MASLKRCWFDSVNVTFYPHENRWAEQKLAVAFVEGLKRHGDKGKIVTRDVTKPCSINTDIVAVVGIKSAEVLKAAKNSGTPFILFDKGYQRWEREGGLYKHWRVSVNGHHPTETLMDIKRPRDRVKQLHLKMKPWRKKGRHIIIAGSSAKYHRYYDLPDPTEWAQGVVDEIRKYTDIPIHYRPKKSWKAATPIKGTVWARSRIRIEYPLMNAWALVTHGSNSCYEALLQGVPSIILGVGVTKSISSTSISKIANPRLADIGDRWQLLANVAYQQWLLREYRSGEAWAVLKEQVLKS